MAQAYVHGATHLIVGLGSGLTPTYLGTGKRAPRYSLRRSWERVMNDLAGVVIPYDYSFQGVEAFITITLTRWNESTLTPLQDVVGAAGAAPAAGIMPPGDIGSLMMTEGLTVPLTLVYAYGPTSYAPQTAYSVGGPAGAGGPMPNGYTFNATFLEGPDDREGGTDPAEVTLVFHAMRQYNPVTGTFTLFTPLASVSGLPIPS